MRIAKAALAAALAALFAAAAQGQTPKQTPPPNERPTVKLLPATDRVALAPGCDEAASVNAACRATSPRVALMAQASDPDGDTMLFTYKTDGGRVVGEGPEVTLDLTGVEPGTYTVSVEVDDGLGGIGTDATKIAVERCTCPLPAPGRADCPTVTVSCMDTGVAGQPLKFTANVSGGDPAVTPTYKWTVPGFRILGGEGASSITVDASKERGPVVTAIVEVGGYDRGCAMSNSCTLLPGLPSVPRKLDEYGRIPVGDEKRRLDNLNEELLNDPAAQGYVVCYGGRRSRASEAQRRCDRARNFLVVSRGIDAARVVTVDGGYRAKPAIELWLVPPGVTPPRATPTVDPKEVTPPRQPRKPRRRAWR